MTPTKTPTKDSVPTKFDAARERLEKDGQLLCTIVSGSMEPVIMTSARVTVVPLVPKDLRRFDILVFEQHGLLICHVFWKQNGIVDPSGRTTYSTFSIAGRGRYFDLPVPQDRIVGKVVSHTIPKRLRFLTYLNRLRYR
jgi:hypothetical protein